MPSFEGKVAIVTGAAGNLGRTVVHALADQGASVALVDLDPDAIEATRAELPPGTEAATFAADLIVPESVAGMVERVLERFGRIDILANIAGGFTMGPPLHQTEDKD